MKQLNFSSKISRVWEGKHRDVLRNGKRYPPSPTISENFKAEETESEDSRAGII